MRNLLAFFGILALASIASAQVRPYIGFVYPAGGQQGTTFQIRLGGQNMDFVDGVTVTGGGVTARVIEYQRRLNPQDTQLMSEQLRILKKAKPAGGDMMMMNPAATGGKAVPGLDPASQAMVARIERRLAEYVNRPACAAIASIAIVEVTIAPDAKPGRRELSLTTLRGVSNPLVFHVGQFAEDTRKAMITADFQVLGKEHLALRKRPAEEVERSVSLPCILNGQIASGEFNRYRFSAKRGQKLVISCEARTLNPFVADAVPGWFQPIMALHDAEGHEVAYQDDYRFKPDPVILCDIPRDGQYVLTITDAIYRGREDFVYRVTMGEVPFITSIFPLGASAGSLPNIQIKGWNLDGAKVNPPAASAAGSYLVSATRNGIVSNCLPFEIGKLPEVADQEPNDSIAKAQKVSLPIVANGRINRADDWDVYAFTGQAGQTIIVEVNARRLESPLDSFVKITDEKGNVVGYNDDMLEDPESGTNTHDADSYLSCKLPASGTYFVHVGDSARHGGEEYAYRVRISQPRPDFSLRVVPASLSMRGKSTANVTVQVIREEGFSDPIQLTLKDPPQGFSAVPTTIAKNQTSGRISIKADMASSNAVTLRIEGRAKTPDGEISRFAVPAEDRMQAFLWRHLVPAQEFKAMVIDPAAQPKPARVPSVRPPPATAPATQPSDKPKFSKSQVESRLRQLKYLFEDGLLTDDFYHDKVAECEAAR